MSKDNRDKDGKAVPFRRLSRLAGLGGMAANVAGGMVAGGVRQIASGKRPKMTDLLMTPSNARKVTRQLSTMRGAAMKIGQMISMDSGDFLPKEFADILARLRADAQNMPRAQLLSVLNREWGENWSPKFDNFDFTPIAAASIGQVHRAKLRHGETLALKVQYPGVKESIDSDVNNVAGLLRMTGLIPSHLDIAPVIEEGRRQLHEEADYIREAQFMVRFETLLNEDPDFQVPTYYPALSTDKILAMRYIESQPIEDMQSAPLERRNRITSLLIDLVQRELFTFRVMQTDPNFANYRYNTTTDQIVLLDFGASREIEPALSDAYRHMLGVILSGTAEAVLSAATEMGFVKPDLPKSVEAVLLEMIDIGLAPLRTDAPFDFGNNPIAAQLRDKATELALNRDLWHVPPANMIFIQRKLGGVYLLATRLQAKINLNALLRPYAETAV